VVLLITPSTVFADHVPTQAPYNQSIALDSSTGDLTVGIYSSDGFEDSPPEKYTIFFTISDSAIDTSTAFCISTSFGHGQNNTWQYHVFKLDDLQTYFENPYGTFRTRIRSDNDTDNSYSTLTDEMTISIPNQEPFVGATDWSAPSSSCIDTSTTTTTSSSTTSSSTTSTTTTTTTTLPKAEDVVEDNITTYLAWDDKGCEHPGNPLSYKEYLTAIESGEWFGYQSGDCQGPTEEELLEIEAEKEKEAEEQRLADEKDKNFLETGIYETDQERSDREAAELQAELDRLAELEAEKDEETKAELEDSGILENLDDEESVEEFVEAIQKIEEETDFDAFDVEEEVLELDDLDIPDEIVLVIETEETDQVEIIEDFDSDEIEEVKEVEEVIDVVEDVIPELPDDIVEPEEAEEIIEEFVESLEPETKVEIIEDVVEVGVEELTDEQVVVVQEVVESAIQDVEVLSEEQVETVAEVLGLEESDDVGVIAEAVKTDEAVAEAVESFVERAVENKDVEDYNLSDVVVEVQVEEFLENPAVIFQVDFEEINLVSLGDDLTNQQKEKAQEVVVPVIIASQIISASVVPFRRLN
jgi:hypothetical protein